MDANNTKITVEMSAKTEAALILACVAIDQLLDTGILTEDIREELEYLQPELDKFCYAKESPHTAPSDQRNAI